MTKIFLSYRRADSGHATGRLYDRLTSKFGPKAVFMDVDNMELGVDFLARIHSEIQECSVVLVVMGPEWMTISDANGQPRIQNPEDYVRAEIEAALSASKPIIPVVLDEAKIPPASMLPSGIRPLTRFNGIAISHASFDADVQRLVTGIAVLLEVPKPKPKPKPVAKAVPQSIPDSAVPVASRIVTPPGPTPSTPTSKPTVVSQEPPKPKAEDSFVPGAWLFFAVSVVIYQVLLAWLPGFAGVWAAVAAILFGLMGLGIEAEPAGRWSAWLIALLHVAVGTMNVVGHPAWIPGWMLRWSTP